MTDTAAPRVAMLVWNEFQNDARVLKEAQTLQRNGYAVTVHALHTPGVTRQHEVLDGGIAVSRVSRGPLADAQKRRVGVLGPESRLHSMFQKRLRLLALAALRSWTHLTFVWNIATSRPAVVHSHDVNTLPTCWLAARLSGAKLVYDAHEISTSREGYEGTRNFIGWVEKHLMPRADATITTTVARAKFFARAYGVPRPVVLQNRPRATAVPKSDRIRRELGLENAWPIIVYQGGIQPGRGLELFVAAALDVPQAYFVLIGSGPTTGELVEQAERLGVSDRVKFIPMVSLADLPDYTASADIGVQPIRNTCFNHFTTDSNKLFEYVMAGLPVVASNLPEIRLIVTENDLGLLSRPDDQATLSQAIRRLVDDASLRNRLAENAHLASRKLTWEEQEPELVGLYARIMKRRP